MGSQGDTGKCSGGYQQLSVLDKIGWKRVDGWMRRWVSWKRWAAKRRGEGKEEKEKEAILSEPQSQQIRYHRAFAGDSVRQLDNRCRLGTLLSTLLSSWVWGPSEIVVFLFLPTFFLFCWEIDSGQGEGIWLSKRWKFCCLWDSGAEGLRQMGNVMSFKEGIVLPPLSSTRLFWLPTSSLLSFVSSFFVGTYMHRCILSQNSPRFPPITSTVQW